MVRTLKWLGALGVLALLFVGLCTPAIAIMNQALREEFDRAISKWVARDSAGRCYLLAIRPNPGGRTRFTLRVSKGASPGSLGDFSQTVELPFSPASPDSVFAAGMVIDTQDRLHLCWNTKAGETGYSWFDLKRQGQSPDFAERSRWLNAETNRPGVLTIAPTGSRLGDITVSPDGTVWLAWTSARGEHTVSVYLGAVKNGRWQSTKLTEQYGAAPPSLLLDHQNNFHLGWHDIYEDGYYLTGNAAELGSPRKWTPKKLSFYVYRPVMAEVGPRIMAAYEFQPTYIQYLFPAEPKPARHELARGDERLFWDTTHSPQWSVDRYGIPWLFFIDSTRQHLFYSRWLGSQWSEIEPSYWLTRNSARFEENHVSIDRIAVEEKMPPNSSGIGVALFHDSEYPQEAFHTIPVPALVATPREKVLFFDLAEMKALDGLVLKVNEAKKDPNPVISAGGPNDFDSNRGGNFLRVLKENGTYRMWYAGQHRGPSGPWPTWNHSGYAESSDGRHFRKVNLGLASFNGNSNNNMIPEFPYVPFVSYDPSDADPQRRYKLLKFSNNILHDDEAKAGRLDPWSESFRGKLLTSPDGIHWRETDIDMAFPAGKPGELIPQSFFHDEREQDPAKQYKAYGYSSLNLTRRGGSYAYSADAIHWTAYAQNPVLDPFARDIPTIHGGKVHQIHDTMVWQYGRYYLAFYQYQHNEEHQDVELAMSRDGENFVFVKPGEKLIRYGEPGSWECSAVTSSIPLVDTQEIKLYYGGMCGEKGSGGLATLRLDGFTDLQLGPSRKDGSLTTIPIERGTASHLFLNADCGEQGYIEAELTDSEGRPLPGYSRQDAIRITGDSTLKDLRWKDKSDLSGVGKGPFQIRLFFSGEHSFPKLYSFEFR